MELNINWEPLTDIYNLIAVMLLLNGITFSAIWFLQISDIAPAVVMLISPFIYLGEIFSSLSIGLIMIFSGIGLLLKRRFGFILSAYTLTVWTLLSLIALFIAPRNYLIIALIHFALFGASLYRFVREREFFLQDIPDVVQIVSLIMFVGGYVGLSYSLNHILYTSTLYTTLILGGGILMMQGAVGLAAKSKIGLWFSMAVLITAVMIDSVFLVMSGGYEHFYRLTLNAVGVYYLQYHKDTFYVEEIKENTRSYSIPLD